ncbi:MAG TPA: ROK family protein [Aestuariivirgaceae bacterium]
MSHAYPLLVADIGGTHARFGVVHARGERPSDIRTIPGQEHPSLQSALQAYLAAVGGEPPRRVCIAVAGPVQPGHFILTNRPQWNTPLSVLKSAFKFELVDVINDFEALAGALPLLERGEREPIGEPSTAAVADVLAVVGPGTGLGVGAAVRTRSGWQALPGEGGHVELASPDPRARAAIGAASHYGRVSAERFLSGPGLELLHATLGAIDGSPRQALDAAAIAKRADSGDEQARDTVAVFLKLLAGFAGDVALMLGARGGVFLSGGVIMRLRHFIDAQCFREDFENKGRLRSYMAAIPVNLIAIDTLALRGCALHLENLEGATE